VQNRSAELRKLVQGLRGDWSRLRRDDWSSVEDRDPDPVLRVQQSALYEVRQALHLAETGSYGTCVDCDDPIAMKRLKACPTSIRCIKCQERFEASTAA
jgi:DnaK suppressor protein